MKNILVISPHPDDESIGCGGTIRKHILEGDTVEVIFLTSGEKGGHGRSEEETIRIREQESRNAAFILQIPTIHFWREPDAAFKATETNVLRLVDKIRSTSAEIIYVPHEHEDHHDHREAALLVCNTLKLLGGATDTLTVWMYEVWTPIQKMDHIVDISPHVDIKLKAIRAYESQCAVLAFDEAILGLNRYRGEMHCWPEGEYAEVFKNLTT